MLSVVPSKLKEDIKNRRKNPYVTYVFEKRYINFNSDLQIFLIFS